MWLAFDASYLITPYYYANEAKDQTCDGQLREKERVRESDWSTLTHTHMLTHTEK